VSAAIHSLSYEKPVFELLLQMVDEGTWVRTFVIFAYTLPRYIDEHVPVVDGKPNSARHLKKAMQCVYCFVDRVSLYMVNSLGNKA
jgi:hypothetical protein